jgi:hypothetical protein
VANNIRVRRAGLALSKASNLNEICVAVSQMLEFEEFAYANLQLGRTGHADACERAVSDSYERRPRQAVEFSNGKIVWAWKRRGVAEHEVIGSSAYWCFRLPLATKNGEWGWINLYRPLEGPPLLLDMNYLAGFLRVELSQAAERVLQSFEAAATEAQVNLTMTAGKIAG